MPRSFMTLALLTALCALSAPLTAADDHAGHDHAGHDHGHGHQHGEAAPIGTVSISGYTVAVAAVGAVNAGQEWPLELALSAGQPAPKAIRVWVGVENGRGSVKAKAEAVKDAKGAYEAHIEVPQPLPADSKLWISLELADGQTAKAALALPAGKAGHHKGDGHQH